MSIDKTDVIFNPAVGSDYCVVTVANIDGRKSFVVIVVEEGGEFPKKVNDEKDIFLEVFNPTGGKITVTDIFDVITEVRVLKEIYLPVRISHELYGESQEFFSQLFSKVITTQYDDFPQSECKH